jgi:hypothetical protein
MNVTRVAQVVGISRSSVIQRAGELYRLSSLRTANVGIGKAELCRAAACVGLACDAYVAAAKYCRQWCGEQSN